MRFIDSMDDIVGTYRLSGFEWNGPWLAEEGGWGKYHVTQADFASWGGVMRVHPNGAITTEYTLDGQAFYSNQDSEMAGGSWLRTWKDDCRYQILLNEGLLIEAFWETNVLSMFTSRSQRSGLCPFIKVDETWYWYRVSHSPYADL